MTRDFAKKGHYKKRKKIAPNKTVTVILIVVLMLFLSVVFFYYYNIFKKKMSLASKNNHAIYNKVVNTVEKIEVKPRFEFYNMLSNQTSQKGESKKVTALSLKNNKVSNNVSNDEKGIFILQIAAFRQVSEAKRLMTEITGKGFQAGLKKDAEQKWIRVQVGPYSSKSTAEQAQRALKDLNYSAILVKIG